VSAYRFFHLPSPTLLLVPIGYCLVGGVIFFAIILNEQLKRVHGGNSRSSDSRSTPLRALSMLPMDYGLLCFIFALLGWPSAFFIIYTLMFLANTAYLALASVKWFTDMRRLGDLPK